MKTKLFLIALSVCLLFTACKKTFLDSKPDNGLVVPTTLPELQALLDNDTYMNGDIRGGIGGPVPGLLIEGCDDYYAQDVYYDTYIQFLKNVYVWSAADPYGGAPSLLDWSIPYRAVFYANEALDGLSKIALDKADRTARDNAEGTALFYRAHTFYMLAQAFAQPYKKQTAATDWGIPLKLTADISDKIERATVAQTYDRIIQDTKQAIPVLPVTPLYKTRPSKPAAYALLARTYQTMQDYDNALLYADSALQLSNSLLNFNTLDPSLTYPFTAMNNEVLIAYAIQNNPNKLMYSSRAVIDTTLYASYDSNDLRKALFFKNGSYPNTEIFRGSYNGSPYPFAGITVDEVYLIRAECNARKNNTAAALQDLNTLLQTRWKTGSWKPFTAGSSSEALQLILTERRKELVMRGLRWTDLRRLNADPPFAVTLKRYIDGQTFTLPPGDQRYTWPIPQDVIGFNPGMPQNPR